MQVRLWRQIGNRPMPLTSSVVEQMMAKFCNFYSLKKGQDLVKQRAVRFEQVQRYI